MPGYQPRAWVNDTSPDINATNLNAIEDAIEDQKRLQLDVRDFGSVGTADDFAVFQAAIDEQQVSTDTLELVVPPGTFNIDSILVPSPNLGAATKPLYLRGAGMRNTILQCGFHPTFGGLFGYGRSGTNPVCAQVVMSDLTIDGNYSGVAGGALAATAGDSLFALVRPFTSVAQNQAPNGVYHQFIRTRFYRTTGYVFQPPNGVQFWACLFDSVGQPDLSSGSTHYDNLGGGGYADAELYGCQWLNSSGNYVDFESPSGEPPRLVMLGCTSRNHQIGGLYGAGRRSRIIGNELENTVAGGGVGYDSGTHDNNRADNIVAHNIFTNLTVLTSSLDSAKGDRVYGNNSDDQPQGAASITVTASPFTYTSGPTQEAVYIRGGTVSSIAKNSVTLFTQTEQTVWLEPGEAVVVTYSSAPTMVKDRK